MEFITKNIKWLAPLAVAALAAIWVISSFVGIRNTGVEKEAGLNAQYKVNQNSLSTCLVKIADSANLTKAESEQLRGALEDAVKLMEQRHADRECVRLGHILRHVATRNRFTPRPRWHVQSTRRRGRECM